MDVNVCVILPSWITIGLSELGGSNCPLNGVFGFAGKGPTKSGSPGCGIFVIDELLLLLLLLLLVKERSNSSVFAEY